MAMKKIGEGDEVFLHDGEIAFGSVRQVHAGGELTIYVEDAGEFLIAPGAIKDAHSGKVILNRAKLGQELLQAIAHAHDEEHEDRA